VTKQVRRAAYQVMLREAPFRVISGQEPGSWMMPRRGGKADVPTQPLRGQEIAEIGHQREATQVRGRAIPGALEFIGGSSPAKEPPPRCRLRRQSWPTGAG